MPKDMHKLAKSVGIYYRDSSEKRYQGKPDRCYYATFHDENGKFVYEKVGWASEGYNAQSASIVRAERIRAIRHGEELPSQKKKKNPLLSEVWKEYDKWLPANKRNPRHDRVTYRVHLEKKFGDRKLSEITAFSLEKVKNELVKAGKSASTVKHVLVLVRQLFNKAILWGMWDKKNPVKEMKLPKVQNERQRFLTVDEADLLLDELEKASRQLMKIAMLSLHTGMRAGEIFGLKWQDVDSENGIINVTSKGGDKGRVFMTEPIKFIFTHPGNPSDFVFPNRKDGGRIKEVSKAYYEAVKRIGLNDGIDDPMRHVNFHSLRHTFASWLAIRGTPLLTIKELLRHKDIKMTMRYSHLIPDHKRDAVNGIERTIQESRQSRPDCPESSGQVRRPHNGSFGRP